MLFEGIKLNINNGHKSLVCYSLAKTVVVRRYTSITVSLVIEMHFCMKEEFN